MDKMAGVNHYILHIVDGELVLGIDEAGVQRFCTHSSQFDSGLILAHPCKPKHKLESLDPAHSLSWKITFPSHFLSWLTDFWSHPEITSSSLENPHMDYPAPRGTGGPLSEWKSSVGGERPCTNVSYHFTDVNQMVPEWELLIFSHQMEEWMISARRMMVYLHHPQDFVSPVSTLRSCRSPSGWWCLRFIAQTWSWPCDWQSPTFTLLSLPTLLHSRYLEESTS